MKSIILSLGLALRVFITQGQESNDNTNLKALQVVQEQLDAYNARDIDRFMEVFSDSVKFVDFKTTKLSIAGKEEVRKRFTAYFEASPNLKSSLAGRIHFDNVVIDHEKITGSRGSDALFEIVMVYELNEAGKIFRASSIRKN
jgi:hypothetical protein